MSKTPVYDVKIKSILEALEPGERTCKLTGETWTMDEEEISWYRKFNVPPSNVSPLTRWKTAISFYAGYQWWWNKHAKTGKPVLTYVHPATGLAVLPDIEWFQEDFSDQGRECDSSQPFFAQFRELQKTVPVLATLNNTEMQNSIAMVSNGDVNSYFVVACVSRDSFFSINGIGERFMEASNAREIHDAFRVVDSENIRNARYALASKNCHNASFLFDCRDVSDSFFAWNQRHKQYLWFNEQLMKEEWERRIAEVDLSSRAVLKEYERQFFELVGAQAIWPDMFNVNAEESTGEYLSNVYNCKNCFLVWNGARDLYWVIHGYDRAERCAFVTGTYSASDLYYCCTVANSSNCLFSFHIIGCRNMEYSMQCFNCEDCFGCIGLRNKKFHIFNKSYSEEEYWKKVDEIKTAMLERGEYGEFFPLTMTHGYLPQSGPGLYLMCEDQEYVRLGWQAFDPESHGAIGQDLAQAQQPLSTDTIPDRFGGPVEEWAGKPILDAKLGRRFSFIKPELAYYKEHGLPLPDEHFISRVQNVVWMSNGASFEDRTCGSCGTVVRIPKNKIFPNRRVFCQPCYHVHVQEQS
ncbi:hypothetical protein HY734_01090 [Candidatus Uhrbacteria bacterium]|nr:hypothetical protein [Candidatus Uhrbacteria bacterium]